MTKQKVNFRKPRIFTGDMSREKVWKILSQVYGIEPHKSIESIELHITKDFKNPLLTLGRIIIFFNPNDIARTNKTFDFYSFLNTKQNTDKLESALKFIHQPIIQTIQ